jgi:hypothetical protein
MVNYKKMYPNADVDPNLRVAVSYVEVGKPGEHGIAAKLPFKNMGDNFYRTSGFEFVEKDFNLKYTVTSENTAISPTGKNAFGELTLRIIDLETNEVVGQTEFPIETFFSGGYGPQLTISLPTKIIEKQKIGLTNDKNLLTQVRFQCN